MLHPRVAALGPGVDSDRSAGGSWPCGRAATSHQAAGTEIDSPSTSREGRARSKPVVALARAQVSHQLSRQLPYYLTPEEAHRLMDAAENERDALFLRLLWETGVQV